MCPPDVLQTSLHFKHRKISQTIHCVPSNAASCWCDLSASFRYLTAVFTASTVVATATAIRYTLIYRSQAAQPRWPTHVFNPILRTLFSAKYVSITAFHFDILSHNFLSSSLHKPGISLSLHHSFTYLHTTCHHPTANATATHFNQTPTAQYISCFRGSEYRNSLAYDHINDSFFIQCYTETKLNTLMHSYSDQ